MAIDFTINKTHNASFPIKVASAMGQYGHIFNGVVARNTDNGQLGTKGDYQDYDQYEVDDLAALNNGFEGVIRGQAPDGLWEIEVTALPSDKTVVYLYNSPVSEYPEVELQDEQLFYTKTGERIQAMQLIVNDVFTMSANGFTGTPVAGKTVTYASNKYVVA